MNILLTRGRIATTLLVVGLLLIAIAAYYSNTKRPMAEDYFPSMIGELLLNRHSFAIMKTIEYQDYEEYSRVKVEFRLKKEHVTDLNYSFIKDRQIENTDSLWIYGKGAVYLIKKGRSDWLMLE